MVNRKLQEIFVKFLYSISEWAGGLPSPIKRIVLSRSTYRHVMIECQRILSEDPGNVYVQNIDYSDRSIQICGIKVECEE